MDLDAIWDGEWGGDRRREGAVLGVYVRHPTITNGDFVASLFSAVRGGDVAFPKFLWDFLLSNYFLAILQVYLLDAKQRRRQTFDRVT